MILAIILFAFLALDVASAAYNLFGDIPYLEAES